MLFFVKNKIFCLSLNLMRWNCFKLSIICVLLVIGAYLLIRTLNEYSLVMRSADTNDVICQVWVVKSSYMAIWLHIEFSIINFLSISLFPISISDQILLTQKVSPKAFSSSKFEVTHCFLCPYFLLSN